MADKFPLIFNSSSGQIQELYENDNLNLSLSGIVNATSIGATNISASSSVTSPSFVGELTGNSSTATALQTSRTISLTGDVVGSVSFNGTSNVSIAATIQPNGVSSGSYGSSTEIPTFTVDTRGRLTSVGTAPVGTALTVAGDSGSENINLLSETLTISGGTNLSSSAASNTITLNLDNNISLNSVSATGIITATDFNATSDVNLKENIRPVNNAVKLVNNLNGVYFSWKSDGKESVGVIAQEIEEYLPQLVNTNETSKTVNYNGLIGVLIQAIKEQQIQIQELKSIIQK